MRRIILLVLLLPFFASAQTRQAGGISFTPPWNFKISGSDTTWQFGNTLMSPQQFPYLLTKWQADQRYASFGTATSVNYGAFINADGKIGKDLNIAYLSSGDGQWQSGRLWSFFAGLKSYTPPVVGEDVLRLGDSTVYGKFGTTLSTTNQGLFKNANGQLVTTGSFQYLTSSSRYIFGNRTDFTFGLRSSLAPTTGTEVLRLADSTIYVTPRSLSGYVPYVETGSGDIFQLYRNATRLFYFDSSNLLRVSSGKIGNIRFDGTNNSINLPVGETVEASTQLQAWGDNARALINIRSTKRLESHYSVTTSKNGSQWSQINLAVEDSTGTNYVNSLGVGFPDAGVVGTTQDYPLEFITGNTVKGYVRPTGSGGDLVWYSRLIAGTQLKQGTYTSGITKFDTDGTLISTASVPVVNGGTGQTSYTNGQLLIGNTTGNTLTKTTLTGTASQINITNGAGSITLSTPQDIATNSNVTFRKVDGFIRATGVSPGSLTGPGVELGFDTGDYGRMFAYNRTTNVAKNLVLQDPGGNVLIGTDVDNSSGARLQVTGGVTTTGLDNYTTDLSGSYTSRSKVDKGYVDKIATAAVANSLITAVASYTISASDFQSGKAPVLDLYADATSGAVSITLPNASTFRGYTIYVTKTDASANVVTVGTVSGSGSLPNQYDSKTFLSNGTSWFNH